VSAEHVAAERFVAEAEEKLATLLTRKTVASLALSLNQTTAKSCVASVSLGVANLGGQPNSHL
jgi:ribonuclease PH